MYSSPMAGRSTRSLIDTRLPHKSNAQKTGEPQKRGRTHSWLQLEAAGMYAVLHSGGECLPSAFMPFTLIAWLLPRALQTKCHNPPEGKAGVICRFEWEQRRRLVEIVLGFPILRLLTFLTADVLFAGICSIWFADPAGQAQGLALVRAVVVFSL